jgi:hypothetical protein
VVYCHICPIYFVGEDIYQPSILEYQIRLKLPASDLNECTALLQ